MMALDIQRGLRNAARWVGMLLALAGPPAAAQELGPKDGRDLPPTDTGRVAIGAPAPDFTLLALDGRRISLSEYRGRMNVVLVFYRGHW